MARSGKKGDTSYNALRRYYRAAERYIKKAESSTGATAERYRQLAKQDLGKAMQTYEKGTTQDFSKPIKSLAEKLGVNIKAQRAKLKDIKQDAWEKIREKAISKSTSRLESAMEDAERRRQDEARALFNSGLGSRIIGGFESIWRDKALTEDGIDKKKMMKAIFDYMKVDNLADLIKKLEEQLGSLLYGDTSVDEIYETVKLMIQNKVADNTLVA